MSVLIRNIKMPKEGFVEVLIRSDGTVQQTGQSYRINGTDYYTPYVGEMPAVYSAIELPPHGRLIDVDALPRFGGRKGLVHSADIDNAPTIIEKELTCNGCKYSLQNCKDRSVCCEMEDGLCDDYAPTVIEAEGGE